jgi:hypothetical protein
MLGDVAGHAGLEPAPVLALERDFRETDDDGLIHALDRR